VVATLWACGEDGWRPITTRPAKTPTTRPFPPHPQPPRPPQMTICPIRTTTHTTVSTKTITLEQRVLAKNDETRRTEPERWLTEQRHPGLQPSPAHRERARPHCWSAPSGGLEGRTTRRRHRGVTRKTLLDGRNESGPPDAGRFRSTPVRDCPSGRGHDPSGHWKTLKPRARNPCCFIEKRSGNLVCPALFDLGEAQHGGRHLGQPKAQTSR